MLSISVTQNTSLFQSYLIYPARWLEVESKARFLALLSPCVPQHTWEPPRATKGGQDLSLTGDSHPFCYSSSASRLSLLLWWFNNIHWFHIHTHCTFVHTTHRQQSSLSRVTSLQKHLPTAFNFSFAARDVQHKQKLILQQ